LDSFWPDLSYSLRLLIGIDAIEIDHGRWLQAMDSVRPPVNVEYVPAADGSLGL
jgi:hypothetical protein